MGFLYNNYISTIFKNQMKILQLIEPFLSLLNSILILIIVLKLYKKEK